MPPIVEIFYCGLMGFFIVSGYFYNKKRSAIETIKKRAIQLLGVMILGGIGLTTILYLWMNCFDYNITIEQYLQCAFEFTFYGYMGGLPYGIPDYYPLCFCACDYYFFIIMFVGFLIFLAIEKWATKSWTHLIISVVLLLSSTALYLTVFDRNMFWACQDAPVATAFMLVGCFVSKFKLLDFIDNGYRKKEYWIAFASCLVISVVMVVFFPTKTNFSFAVFGNHGGLSVYTFFVINLAGFYVDMVLTRFLAFVPYVGDVFSFVGKYTLAILALHSFIIKMISCPIYTCEDTMPIPAMDLPVAIAVGIVAIILSILAMMVYQKAKERITKKPARDIDE